MGESWRERERRERERERERDCMVVQDLRAVFKRCNYIDSLKKRHPGTSEQAPNPFKFQSKRSWERECMIYRQWLRSDRTASM